MVRHLNGMKILDFTYLLPGPFGSMMLADLGADIIKVENPANPDLMRYMPPFVEGMSAVYAHVNRGKRSLGLNLTFPESRDIIRSLVKEYDIVLEQFRPGVMSKFGLGYGDLRKENPSLIYCSLTGYGQTGSYARRAGHDINYMALSGIESFSGRPGEGPSLSGIQVADIGSGSKNLCIAVMAAYIRRLGTGEGDYADISITDGAFSLSVFQTAAFLSGGPEPGPGTEVLNGAALYDYYRTSDGRYISVGSIEPKFLTCFLETLGMSDLLSGGLLSEEQMIAVKRDVARNIASRPLSHWVDAFGGVEACVEPVRTLGEAVENPPLSEREMIVEVPGENGAVYRQTANPLKFASGPCNAEYAGTSLGSHTDNILAGIGFSSGEIAALREKGAAG